MADLVTLHEGDVLVLRAKQPDDDYARAVLAESAAEIGRLTGTTIVLLEPDQSLEKADQNGLHSDDDAHFGDRVMVKDGGGAEATLYRSKETLGEQIRNAVTGRPRRL